MTTNTSALAISARAVRKSFGDHVALDGVDLTVTKGTIFALLGPNGAGKTTVVNILSTLLKPDAGTANVNGFDVTEYQEQADLAREGLALLADAPPERKAVLLEMAAFADFLVARLPELEKDWKAHREALRTAGEIPDTPQPR